MSSFIELMIELETLVRLFSQIYTNAKIKIYIIQTIAFKNMPISQFVNKLLDMIESHPKLISWSQDGTQFTINDQSSFSQSVLPVYFRHTRFQSFIRQLNMYSFHKVCRRKNSVSFFNQYFLRDKRHLYHNIIRRKQETQTKTMMQLEQQIQKARGLIQMCVQPPVQIFEIANKMLEYKRKLVFDVRELKGKLQAVKKQIGDQLCKIYKQEFNFIKQGMQDLDLKQKTMQQKIQKILNRENQQEIQWEQDLKNSKNLLKKQVNYDYKTSQSSFNEHHQCIPNDFNSSVQPKIQNFNATFKIDGYQSFSSISHFIS